ncbi:inner membrane protein YpjD [Alteromonas sediminis]|uniref:Inner membrane protein YpjD n=1 Tax=Alteromonas sediminis TaxID=2259342 RepID=A0A3N5Y5N4_9ALTE|nr:cytochrome c biogenesis protein CcsA [Alteromonas sediminis]RPJ68466.1 inner membrane protein YpjD [Alteromonas sediminis]
MDLQGILVALTAVLYLTAAALILRRVVTRSPLAAPEYALAMLGGIAHLLFLTQVIFIADGQNMSITNVLSLVSWLITITMIVSARFLPNGLLLPGAYVFSALTVIAAGMVPVEYAMHFELKPGLIVHVTLSLMAYGSLSIAFLYALQMSFITYQLKHKGASLINSPLPPLMLVESILFKLTTVGSVLLFISLLSGFVFIDNMLSAQYAHKTVLSVLALVVYLVLLFGQRRWGWRNRQVIGLTSVALALLTLAYFGSRLVREVLL